VESRRPVIASPLREWASFAIAGWQSFDTMASQNLSVCCSLSPTSNAEIVPSIVNKSEKADESDEKKKKAN